MRINLIPAEFRPTAVNLVPYLVLAGLLAACPGWASQQLAATAHARGRAQAFAAELNKFASARQESSEVDRKLADAKHEGEALVSRAAFVTVLSRKGFPCTELLEALAASAPANVRLTEVRFDTGEPLATISGYGTEDEANVDIPLFLQALSAQPAVRRVFHDVKLEDCNSARRGEMRVETFSISMAFRNASPSETTDGDKEPENRKKK